MKYYFSVNLFLILMLIWLSVDKHPGDQKRLIAYESRLGDFLGDMLRGSAGLILSGCLLFGISHSYEFRISLFRFKPIRMKFVNSFEIWIESAIFRHVVDFGSGPRTHFHARQR